MSESSLRRPHEWIDRPDFLAAFDRDGVTAQVCRHCGVMRRADGQNAECRGPVKVALRGGLGIGAGAAVQARRNPVVKSNEQSKSPRRKPRMALPPVVKASTMLS